jgi:hypothetical protein
MSQCYTNDSIIYVLTDCIFKPTEKNVDGRYSQLDGTEHYCSYMGRITQENGVLWWLKTLPTIMKLKIIHDHEDK